MITKSFFFLILNVKWNFKRGGMRKDKFKSKEKERN